LADLRSMKKQTFVFTTFCLGLTSVGLLGFNILSSSLDRDYDSFVKAEKLEQQLQKRELELSLLRNQLADLRNSVIESTQIANLNSSPQSFAKLRINNVQDRMRSPASLQPLEFSARLFSEGRSQFLKKKYSTAIPKFAKIIETYPLSPFQVESYFFLAESYFQEQDFRAALKVIDEMMTQFPDNELTGFIMLRMGQISEVQQKNDEALEVYQTVAKNFKNPNLIAQANSLAGAISKK